MVDLLGYWGLSPVAGGTSPGKCRLPETVKRVKSSSSFCSVPIIFGSSFSVHEDIRAPGNRPGGIVPELIGLGAELLPPRVGVEPVEGSPEKVGTDKTDNGEPDSDFESWPPAGLDPVEGKDEVVGGD